MAPATVDASTALVIIDVQQGMFMFERPLWHGDDILGGISGLLRGARQANACIVHVPHDGGPGHLLPVPNYERRNPSPQPSDPVLSAEQIVAHHNCTLGGGFVALSRTDEVMFRSE